MWHFINIHYSLYDCNVPFQLAELTEKSEDVVVIALHDTGNDADKAVMLLLEGGDKQV